MPHLRWAHYARGFAITGLIARSAWNPDRSAGAETVIFASISPPDEEGDAKGTLGTLLQPLGSFRSMVAEPSGTAAWTVVFSVREPPPNGRMPTDGLIAMESSGTTTAARWIAPDALLGEDFTTAFNSSGTPS